jgi:hypothetical protein
MYVLWMLRVPIDCCWKAVFSDEKNLSLALEPHEICESTCFQAGAIRRRFSQLAKKSLSQLL